MNIKIGQYIPGDSLLHKLDPRIKLISMILLIVSIFLIRIPDESMDSTAKMISFGWIGGLLFLTLILVFLSGIPLGKVLQGLKAVVFLLTFTFVIQLFTIRSGTLVFSETMTLSILSIPVIILLIVFYQWTKMRVKFRTTYFFLFVFLVFFVQWGLYQFESQFMPGFGAIYDFEVWTEGLFRALFIFIRFILVMIIASLLTFTTTTIELNDGLETIMYPLRLIKVPTYIISMMMSLTLRSIPTLLEETDKIMKAQTSRGADFNEATLKEKISQIIALLIPVFVISFNRADDLSNAMEARGYIIGAPRTKLDEYKIKPKDIVAISLVVIVLAACIVSKILYAI